MVWKVSPILALCCLITVTAAATSTSNEPIETNLLEIPSMPAQPLPLSALEVEADSAVSSSSTSQQTVRTAASAAVEAEAVSSLSTERMQLEKPIIADQRHPVASLDDTLQVVEEAMHPHVPAAALVEGEAKINLAAGAGAGAGVAAAVGAEAEAGQIPAYKPCFSNSCGPTGRMPTVPSKGPEADRLDAALTAIKQDILVRNRQIEDEKKWVAEVRKITQTYETKIKRVLQDIDKTKLEVKTLFRKKKQIENMKIQLALESKLKDATSDLDTLGKALAHVRSKQDEFTKTKNEIKNTILGIHTQLMKLRGDKDAHKKLPAIRRQLEAADQPAIN